MTQSMTGFARVQAESELGTLSIELKAVNSRYLDMYFKVPEAIKPFEATMRQLLGKRLARGKVECAVRFYASASEQLSVNTDYVDALLSATQPIAETHALEQVGVGDLLRLPGVLVDKPCDTAQLKSWFTPLFEQAIDDLVVQRQSEGQHLNQLMTERLQSVREIVGAVQANYQQSIASVQGKLREKLDELAERHRSEIDEVRFEQEMIYLLQKMDVAEEIDRLNGHIGEVEKLLSANVPVGRKLDFLMQEMNRESNTIGSKSQNLGLTMNAVDLKVLLEQMREQIQNIE